MNKNYKLHMFIAKSYNYFINSRISIFINFNILSIIIALLAQDFYLILFMEPLIVLLSLTTYRLSRIAVYSSTLKFLSMNLDDINMFSEYDYDSAEGKQIISDIFKDEFILFLENAHKKNFKKIKMTTHKWVVNNVVLDDRVTSLYNVEVAKCGKCYIILEVLLLAGKYTPSAYIERDKYKVILTKKEA